MRWLERWFSFRRSLKDQSAPTDGLRRTDAKLERALNYHFRDRELFRLALTHRSAADGTRGDYERLEFLGDAVLDLIVADFLMRRFPEATEGALSKLRASIVNTHTLASKARALGIGDSLRLGKGEANSGGRHKVSILAAAFEALIGAIYTESGLEAAKGVVEPMFASDIGTPGARRDYKTELQEAGYRHFGEHPVYELTAESGPEHAKRFVSRVRIGQHELGVGEGSSKKQSEQAAARRALELILEQRHERGDS
jgi:ribonuclease-3